MDAACVIMSYAALEPIVVVAAAAFVALLLVVVAVAVARPKFVFVSLLNFALERSATNDIRTASYFLIYSQLLFVHQTPGWSCLLLTPVPHPRCLLNPQPVECVFAPAAGRRCSKGCCFCLSLVGCRLSVAGCLPVVSCR